jgi:hypothetical protein
MRVWQIALDSQKHEKYAFHAQINIGLSEIGTFLNIKEYIRNGLVF